MAILAACALVEKRPPTPSPAPPAASAPHDAYVRASGQGSSTTITWSTGDGSGGEVYLSQDGGPEALFARAAEGSMEVPWVTPGTTYEFRLYAGTDHATRLAAVAVGPPRP